MSVLHGQGLTRSWCFADVFKELAMAFKEFKEKGQRLDFIAHLYCKHGQNRSVGTATLMIEAPLSIKYVVLLVLLPRTWYIYIYIYVHSSGIYAGPLLVHSRQGPVVFASPVLVLAVFPSVCLSMLGPGCPLLVLPIPH